MSTTPTPGALSAAKGIQEKINAACDRLGIQKGRDEAQTRGILDMAIIIDRETGTAELLAAIKNLLVAESAEDKAKAERWAFAAIAKHEART